MLKSLFLFFSLGAVMQATGQPTFGILGGASIAKTSAAESSSHVGLYVGGVMHLNFGKSGSFRPELKYIMKGETGDNGKGAYNYLELPLNIVAIIPSSIGRFSIGGGPAISYMISGSWTGEGESKEKIYFDYDEVNQFDFGLNVVGGLEVKGGLFFTLNYTFGLADVWQGDNIGANKNRTIGIGIGLMF